MSLTIACVRQGTAYGPEYVTALARGSRWMCPGCRVVCLTDDPAGAPEADTALPLREGWPGWWAKMEMFRPGLLKPPVLYLDLDTVLVGEWRDLVCPPFAMLRDFTRPKRRNTGVLMWSDTRRPDLAWRSFMTDPKQHMRQQGIWGDGGFMNAVMPDVPLIQDKHPGKVLSWRVDQLEDGAPESARIVCFHGVPKPADVTRTWIGRYWRT